MTELGAMGAVSGPAIVMRALVDVFATCQEMVAWLQTQDRVVKVDRSCWMYRVERTGDDSFGVGRGDGFEIEWYAEADFDFGPTISYAMTVTWDTNEWIVGTSVRGHGKDGEEEFDELSHTVKNEDAVLEAIKKMSMDFHTRREEGLRKFHIHFGAAPND